MSIAEPIVYAAYTLAALIVLVQLLSHRSAEPSILGIYSLGYFVFCLLSASAIIFGGILFYRFRLKAIAIILAILLPFILSAAGIEASGQIYAFFHPSYQVLAWEPDRVAGWKLVPHLKATWAGHHWYAREFSTLVEANSHGFRETERTLQKPPHSIRIALVGDSLVEALQVPLEKTAGRLLEQTLNDLSNSAAPSRIYEVLNFGVSNYGVGQFLLNWERSVHLFEPDYVFILVAGFHLKRTVSKYEAGAFPRTQEKQLWIRPTFRLQNGVILREEARDFDEFVRVQDQLLRNDFEGKRARRRGHQLFTPQLLRQGWFRLNKKMSAPGKRRGVDPASDVDQDTIAVNLKVIEELGRGVVSTGGQLVVVDASLYFDRGAAELEEIIRIFSTKKGFGHISLTKALLKAEEGGVSPRWVYDGHFNEAGNAILADAIYRWIAERITKASDELIRHGGAPPVGESF